MSVLPRCRTHQPPCHEVSSVNVPLEGFDFSLTFLREYKSIARNQLIFISLEKLQWKYAPQIGNAEANHQVSEITHEDGHGEVNKELPSSVVLVFVKPIRRLSWDAQIARNINSFSKLINILHFLRVRCFYVTK